LRQLDEERSGLRDGRPSRPPGPARRRRVEVVELVTSVARPGRRLQSERPQEHRGQRSLLLLRDELNSEGGSAPLPKPPPKQVAPAKPALGMERQSPPADPGGALISPTDPSSLEVCRDKDMLTCQTTVPMFRVRAPASPARHCLGGGSEGAVEAPFDCLAARHRTDDEKRLGSRHARLRQRGVRAFLGQTLLTAKEPHE